MGSEMTWQSLKFTRNLKSAAATMTVATSVTCGRRSHNDATGAKLAPPPPMLPMVRQYNTGWPGWGLTPWSHKRDVTDQTFDKLAPPPPPGRLERQYNQGWSYIPYAPVHYDINERFNDTDADRDRKVNKIAKPAKCQLSYYAQCG